MLTNRVCERCAHPFSVKFGPGRPRLYCDSCRDVIVQEQKRESSRRLRLESKRPPKRFCRRCGMRTRSIAFALCDRCAQEPSKPRLLPKTTKAPTSDDEVRELRIQRHLQLWKDRKQRTRALALEAGREECDRRTKASVTAEGHLPALQPVSASGDDEDDD